MRMVQMELIEGGDSRQVLEYMKELNKSSDGDTLGGIQRETMLYIVETSENNSKAIEAFIKIFNCTKYRANKIFSEVLTQYDLESPTARSRS